MTQAPEGGSVMVRPGRRERQPAAEPGPPPSRAARHKALAWAHDRFEGSLTQSFFTRLKILDFANQAVLFGAGLLVSLLPFVILLSAFASQRVDDDIALRLGLDRRAAGIVDHLFTSAPATLTAATATSRCSSSPGCSRWRAPCSRSMRRSSAKIIGASGSWAACWPGS
jgi:hypothetical protein